MGCIFMNESKTLSLEILFHYTILFFTFFIQSHNIFMEHSDMKSMTKAFYLLYKECLLPLPLVFLDRTIQKYACCIGKLRQLVSVFASEEKRDGRACHFRHTDAHQTRPDQFQLEMISDTWKWDANSLNLISLKLYKYKQMLRLIIFHGNRFEQCDDNNSAKMSRVCSLYIICVNTSFVSFRAKWLLFVTLLKMPVTKKTEKILLRV